ncbi:MAG: tyrosine-type recombinase/integrase [Meiothermus sp.]|nr:tyrosine-type recombinase/integrase [Meiothermus sp.]
MKVAEAFDDFLLYKRSMNVKPGTLTHYRQTFRVFADFLETEKVLEVGAVTKTVVRKFWVYLQEQDYALPGYIRDLKALFRFIEAEKLVDLAFNPVTAAGVPKAKDKPVKPLNPSAVDRLLEAAGRSTQAARNRCMLLLLLDTGARVQELLNVNVSDINQDNRSIQVRGKGDRDRSLYYGYKTARHLNAYLRKDRKPVGDTPRLFLNDQGNPWTYEGVSQVIKRLKKSAGLPADLPVSAHKFRHTFATQFLVSGGSALALQRLLGHSTLEMTRRYSSLADEHLAEAHAKAGPVDRLWGR